MEAVLLHRSFDHSPSPYKSNFRNPRKIQYPLISRPSENFSTSHFPATSLLQAPPPFLSKSYPPYSVQQPQPPILPLPAANPRLNVVMYPLANKKTNNGDKTRDPFLTRKKSKSLKKGERNSPKKPVNMSSASSFRPDLTELPRDVAKVTPLVSSPSGAINSNGNNCISRHNSLRSPAAMEDEVDVFSGSAVFTISPPPSSLPLPTFSLRPKLSCKAEAAAIIDAGATDDLRRLLRLR